MATAIPSPGNSPHPVPSIAASTKPGEVATLTGTVRLPAGIVANNSGNYQVLAALDEAPAASVTVQLVDAAGQPVKDVDGQPVTATTDAQGHYSVAAALPSRNLVARVDLGAKGTVEAVVPKTDVARQADLDVVSTLTTGYILTQFVTTQADPLATLDKLPATVEADTRTKAANALATGQVPIPDALTSAAVNQTVDSLRKADTAFNAQLDYVKSLLVIGSLTASITDGDALQAQISPIAIAMGPNGTLYVAEADNRIVREVTPDGKVGTLAGSGLAGHTDGVGKNANFDDLVDIAVDSKNVVYVAHSKYLRKITPDGQVTTLVDGSSDDYWQPTAVTVGSDDALYVAAARAGGVEMDRVGADGKRTVLVPPAGDWNAEDIAVTPAGDVYVADAVNDALWKVSGGERSAIHNDGMIGAFGGNVAVDDGGQVYVATNNGHILKLGADGTLSLYQTGSGSMAFDAAGNLYLGDRPSNKIVKVTPDGTHTTYAGTGKSASVGVQASSTRFSAPQGVAVDADGNLYVADSVMRKVSPAGQVSSLTLADGKPFPAGSWIVRTADGTFYMAAQRQLVQVTPDGVLSALAGDPVNDGHDDGTGTAATFSDIGGLALAPNGDIVLAEGRNHLIRRITPAGVVTTIAGTGAPGYVDGPAHSAQFNYPSDCAVAADGTIFVADGQNRCIRKIDAQGIVSTVAGAPVNPGSQDGTGPAAQFEHPTGIVVDSDGTLYVGDLFGQNIRKVTPDGVVTTIPVDPPMDGSTGMVLDGHGNLYVAAPSNHVVVRVPLH